MDAILTRVSRSPRNITILATTLLVLVLLLWSCVSTEEPETPVDEAAVETTVVADPPPITPVTGGTDAEGQPEPPPIHAVFSVVVRADTSWFPYAGPELNGLDHEAAEAVARRLRQLDAVLTPADVGASIELAYGPAAALCEVDAAVLDELEANGHRIGMHVRSSGEAFRAQRALEACGRQATTASGIAGMADPNGPAPPTVDSLNNALAILSVLDVTQVVGKVSTLCTDLGLAEATHGYGTGSFTAPWRSGWTAGQPCNDFARGRIVVVDQNLLAPAEGETRIDAAALSTLRARTDQTLAYALDLRFAEVDALPAPGIITWGVSVRLDDLIAADPPPEADSDTGEGNGGDNEEGDTGDNETEATTDGESEADPPPVDVRTAPLSSDTLAELALVISEKWAPSMESGRLRWMLPDELGLMMRPPGRHN